MMHNKIKQYETKREKESQHTQWKCWMLVEEISATIIRSNTNLKQTKIFNSECLQTVSVRAETEGLRSNE